MGDERFSKDYDNAVDVNLLDFVESVHSMKDEKMIIAECVPDTTAKKIQIISARKIKSDNGQVLNVEPNSSPQPTSKTLLDYNVANNIVPNNSENVNSNERNSKISKEDGINLAKLNEITSTNAVENDYGDLQIEAKPPKKAQEQKNTEPHKNEPKEKVEKP